MSFVLDPRSGGAAATAGTAREWFGKFLKDKRLSVHPQSSLARALRSLETVTAWTRGAPVPELTAQERYEIASEDSESIF
jgi:hypothetical protein